LSADFIIKGIVATLIYSVLGILMMAIGFKVLDALTPGTLSKIIMEEKNLAAGVLAAAMVIGISIIIASAIVG
ncbi:MAG: DUF350 domain-containing protein, partial [Bacteroidia bacterium]|nr:DUF350 domain-containing protein [Bacteroidia bacterium]